MWAREQPRAIRDVRVPFGGSATAMWNGFRRVEAA